MVTCPRCGSENVERNNVGFGTIGCALLGFSGILMIIGLFFLPLLIVAFLFLIGAFASFFLKGATGLSKKTNRLLKWSWRCKRCHKVFTQALEESNQKIWSMYATCSSSCRSLLFTRPWTSRSENNLRGVHRQNSCSLICKTTVPAYRRKAQSHSLSSGTGRASSFLRLLRLAAN